MSVERRAMQLETALRSLALTMQLSNLVKTLVLRATSVPTRTPNVTAMTIASTPQTIPATAWPEFVAPPARPLVLAMMTGSQAQSAILPLVIVPLLRAGHCDLAGNLDTHG
jgi:hypothetical protein